MATLLTPAKGTGLHTYLCRCGFVLSAQGEDALEAAKLEHREWERVKAQGLAAASIVGASPEELQPRSCSWQ